VDYFELRAQAAAAADDDFVGRSLESAAAHDLLQREVSTLYEDHGGALLRYARSVARNPEIARDAVQEAFLRYYSQRSSGANIETPRAWLYRVVYNYLMDTIGRADVSLAEASRTPDTGTTPQEQAEASSLEARFTQILSPRELACVRLRSEGLSYDEIGSVLGVRIGTVGAMLARAVRKIKKELNRS
jgi:RNA polymerase sigma-70 factor, ECF subfamily